MRHSVLLATGLLCGISSISSGQVSFNFIDVTDAGDGWELYSYTATRDWPHAASVRTLEIRGPFYGTYFPTPSPDYLQLVAPDGWHATFDPGGWRDHYWKRFTYTWKIEDGLPSWTSGSVSGFGILFKQPLDPNHNYIASRRLLYAGDGWGPSDGNWVSTVPIPSPGVLSILALGGLSMTCRRRRS